MADQRSYRIATHIEVLLHAPITSLDGKRMFKSGEIVRALIDPSASVRIYRNGQESRGVDATFGELSDAEIVRRVPA